MIERVQQLSLLLALLITPVPGTWRACASNEAFPVLQMDKILGDWNGTHFYGDKTYCSRVQIIAHGEDKWTLNRTIKLAGQVSSVVLQQPDRKSGRLKGMDSFGNKFEIIVLTTIYNSHILLQECTPEGNVTTTFLRRPMMTKINADTELETALYDVNIRKERLQFCQESGNACKEWATVVTPLDERRMQGLWREAGRIRTTGTFQERSCVYLALEPASCTNVLSLRLSYIENGNTHCVTGGAKYKHPEKKAAVFTLNGTGIGVGEFWILDTNYDSYAVVSLCNMLFPGNQDDEGDILILSRTGILSSADAFAINAATISVGSNDLAQHLNPGFERLDKILDIVPQNCKLDTAATCGVCFQISSPLLISVFVLLLILR